MNKIFPDDTSWKRAWIWHSILCFIVVMFASVYSYGFFNYDEYFSIIQFVNFKLDGLPFSSMHWEYHHHIRSWLLPFILYCIAKFLMAIGIKNPFVITFVFRAFAGITGWVALNTLALLSYDWIIDRSKRLFQLKILFFLYFIPFILVRTASENFAFTAFALAFFILLSLHLNEKRPVNANRIFLLYLLSGILLGVSFEFRYQAIIMILALIAWLALIAHQPQKYTICICIGIVFALTGGAIIDRWGYGTWVFAPWNYFNMCIIQNVQEGFGFSPFYAYVIMLLKNPMFLINIFIIAGAFGFWIRYPRHAVTWITLAFFIVHCFIGHKEIRFMIPITPFSAFFIGMGLPNISSIFKTAGSFFRSKVLFIFRILLYVINCTALVFLCFSVRQPEIKMQKFIYYNYTPQSHWYSCGYDPYSILRQPMTFYKPASFTCISIETCQPLEQRLNESTHPAYFIGCASCIADSAITRTYNPQLIYTGIPLRHTILLFMSNRLPSSLKGSLESYINKQKDRSIYLIVPKVQNNQDFSIAPALRFERTTSPHHHTISIKPTISLQQPLPASAFCR